MSGATRPGAIRPRSEAQALLARAQSVFHSFGEEWNPYSVDVELLATLLFGLGVQRVPDLRVGDREYAAFLSGDSGLIVVEAHHHQHRQRFSIAHEVGHYVLHLAPTAIAFACSPADMEVDRSDDRNQHRRQEWEANLFAAELLMPEKPLLAMYRATGGRLRELARHFAVSPKALEIRLSGLALPFPPR